MSIQNISKILLNNNSYYFVEEVKQICPAFFYGCAKTSRMIIDKKKINNTDYIYATYAPKNLKWKLSEDSVKSAKILLTCKWVEQNIPNWGTENGITTNNEKLDLEIAPQLLELKDEEQFKDENGNIVKIETRGIKTIDGIYFYGKDVEKILEFECITDILNNPTSKYEINIHYKKFIRSCQYPLLTDNKKSNKKTTYLTYNGLLKLILSTRKNVPVKFTDWLYNLLGIPFTHIKFISAETDTIESIRKSICSESITQYSVDKYRIDLYFPEYNLAIECDENEHKDRDIDYEIEREIYIRNKLRCSFIRYNPYSDNFDIFKIIREINNYIINYKTNENNIFKNKLEKKQNEIEKLKIEHENELLRKDLKIQELEHINKYKDLELKMKEMELVCLRNNIKV